MITPLDIMPPIPLLDHPGAFGVPRHQHVHTGVDLYAPFGTPVRAIEIGKIIAIDWFTGPSINMPWWNDTRAVYIEGHSGVFNYGEIQEYPNLNVGDNVYEGQYIGYILTVLKKFKGRPMSMLHLELYDHGFTDTWREWKIGDSKPEHLQNPTQILKNFPNSHVSYNDPFEKSVRFFRNLECGPFLHQDPVRLEQK